MRWSSRTGVRIFRAPAGFASLELAKAGLLVSSLQMLAENAMRGFAQREAFFDTLWHQVWGIITTPHLRTESLLTKSLEKKALWEMIPPKRQKPEQYR